MIRKLLSSLALAVFLSGISFAQEDAKEKPTIGEIIQRTLERLQEDGSTLKQVSPDEFKDLLKETLKKEGYPEDALKEFDIESFLTDLGGAQERSSSLEQQFYALLEAHRPVTQDAFKSTAVFYDDKDRMIAMGTVVRADEVQQNRDAPDRADRGETNPNRPTNDRPRVGFQDGYAGGTSLSESALRNQFAIIQSQIGRQIDRPTSIDEATWSRLSATYQIRVAVDGQIVDFQRVTGSGNSTFDAQVEVALNRFRSGRERLRLSSLNDEVRQAFIEQGFRITVRP